MPLTNAERQKRHRERLHAKANSPGEMLRAECLKWLASVEKETREDPDHTDEEIARIEHLRAEVQNQSQARLEEQMEGLINPLMNDRLRRVRLPKPAKARRLKPAARS